MKEEPNPNIKEFGDWALDTHWMRENYEPFWYVHVGCMIEHMHTPCMYKGASRIIICRHCEAIVPNQIRALAKLEKTNVFL